ncbi:MarR family winged helix-turn-helix transcriptional regulator [Micromonospora sp. NBC_01813]|uniref:MarR family winged helix-turn-helix transcriptional regulator n=1 Tax=Micromonospora sp. NBC_01813 TaxID=2975988 RepID=UPI002DD87536|nr:MarR family transcriptional regulator [Micromonospora sp. NBC_01813]WSA07175.1 MarR family transcriptional regulator [Micromonospora sp. NBC_01813]
METGLELRHQVCFALYTASRAMTDLYREVLDELGLTYPQYLVLLALWERPADPPTVTELGQALQLDSGTLSPLLKRMAAGGLVSRERASRDERQVQIHLTTQGQAMRQRAAQVPVKVATATGLTLDQLIELRHTLTTMTEHIHRTKGRRP